MKRQCGVLMHISSLPGKYSCGSFGKEALDFVDFLADCGFTLWQTLPFCMPDEHNSPYKSYSAFSINPNFIDLEILCSKGLLTKDEIISSEQKTPYSCEFDRLTKKRLELLFLAASRCTYTQAVEDYADENLQIKALCTFLALREKNMAPWDEWTDTVPDEKDVFAWKFIQYEFYTQWMTVKEYANSRGIRVIGDIPIYVAYDSCDVWNNKEMFQLDKNGKMTAVAGCPPDYFSEDGQLWGNPLYDWKRMKKDSFSWWKERMCHMFKYFDGVRIDHFRGLESYWSIPAEAKSAKEGKWVKGPGKPFINMLNSLIDGDRFIIAEDLGEYSPDVEALVKYSTFPGMRIMQFGFEGDLDSTHTPHNYPSNCVAYTGTHDNNTLLGYVWEMESESRQKMLDYCGYNEPDWNKCYDALIQTLYRSHADTVILPIQDILRYGSDTRINTPGKAEGNWSFRVTEDQLNAVDRKKYNDMARLFSR